MSKRILFIVAALGLAAAGLYFRSANIKEAHAQATTIAAQDAAGTNTAPALTSLTDYVKAHMGTSITIRLNSAYTRAEAAANASAAPVGTNSQIYADAQRACSGKTDSITQARCNQEYLANHLITVATPSPIPAPKLATYQHTLTAPFWTPDLTGALFLGAAAAFVYGILGFTRRRF